MELGNYKALMPAYIEKSGDLVGCHHSGMDKRPNEQGKIELLSQCNGTWTAEMSNDDIENIENDNLKMF